MATTIHEGDALTVLRGIESESVHCCVTSPPYWGLRDYGVDGQLGLEDTPEAFVDGMVAVFREVRRVLRADGTLWLNIGDSYAGSTGATGGKGLNTYQKEAGATDTAMKPNKVQGCKPKDLVGIPWLLAFALRADGWYLRSEIIWHKPNPMPESVRDRPTKAHEQIFLLAKSAKYFYDWQAVAEPLLRPEEADRKTPAVFGGANKFTEAKKQSRLHSGNEYRGTPTGTRNLRSVWTIATAPYKEAHFATFPPKLIEPCIKAGTSEKGCCPECGSPWQRKTKKIGSGKVYERGSCDADHRGTGAPQRTGSGSGALSVDVITTGWWPTCACYPPPADAPECFRPDYVPCTVLDPFLGAGTTALVADRLGRDCIGIELNPEYAALAKKRLRRDAPLFAEVNQR